MTESDSFNNERSGKLPIVKISKGMPVKASTDCLKKLFLIYARILPPWNHNRNRFLWWDNDCINRTIHPAQMAYLAIRRICNECFFRLWVFTDNVGGAGFYTFPATDAPLNGFYGHTFTPCYYKCLLFISKPDKWKKCNLSYIIGKVQNFRKLCQQEWLAKQLI